MSIKMLNMKSEHVLCVMEQLWARGPRHHLLSSVAPALGHSSLLHQLFVHLLPAPAAAAHDLLLREDPAGSASSGEAGELTAHVTFDLCVMCDVHAIQCVCVCQQVSRINRSSAERREGRVLLMVVCMVTGYLLCWMPYGVVAILASFGRPGVVPPAISLIPSLLAKTSTVLNPVIYVLLNHQVTAIPCKVQDLLLF